MSYSPANNRRGVPKGYHFLREEEIERRMEALNEHPSNRAAAEALGISENALTTWRMRHGVPGKLGPGKGRTLPPEETARRRKLHEMGVPTQEAANRLGISAGAWTSWLYYHGLKSYRDPGTGPIQKISRTQRRLLGFLEEHPWSTAEGISNEFGINAEKARHSLRRLWHRGYVSCCLHERKKKFALADTELPRDGSKFLADFPNPYHRLGVKEEILRVLEERPWLMRWELVEALGQGITDPSIQYHCRLLKQKGLVQSRLHKMPNGQVLLLAPKNGPSFRWQHARRVLKAFIEHTGVGAVPPLILEYVGKHPWCTVQEISEGIGRPYSTTVQWTPRLEREGKLQRILRAEGVPGRHGQGTHRDRWALADVEKPEGWVDARNMTSMEIGRVRLARIVRSHAGMITGEIAAAYRERHKKGSYSWISHNLNRLEDVGVVKRVGFDKRGRIKAIRWYPNGKGVIDLTARTADAYRRAIEASAMKLRELGYDVTWSMAPKGDEDA